LDEPGSATRASRLSAPTSARRSVWAWALYDFANSSFTTLVVTFIYAAYFVRGIAPSETIGTAQWSTAILITAIVVSLIAPVLGAIADRGGYRKRLLFLATLSAIIATVVLFFPKEGQVVFALSVFVVANISFEAANVFYNAYLPDIASGSRIGRISGFGWALGYVGGLICLALALIGFVQPDTPWFGFSTEGGENIRATNLLVAVWFAVFAVPMFAWVRDPDSKPVAEVGKVVKGAFRQLGATFTELRRYRQIFRMLLARLVYNDGLVTIFAFGGIYAVGTFDFTFNEVILFGIALNVSAGLGALIFGFIDDRIGGRKTILISLVGLVFATALAVIAQTKSALWIAGVLLGLLVGPNQSASRSLIGRFIPEGKENEFFGFFAFSGKATSFLGPLLLGQLTLAFDSQRYGVAVIAVFFIVGGFLLLRVNEAEGIRISGRATTSPTQPPA
jgi:UMF1 family MFS transporter